LNSQTNPVSLFPDLLGFRAIPRERTVEWTLFFDTHGAMPAQRSKRIDGKLVRALIALPVAVTGECEIDDYHSLAVRDLQRGQGVGLPSGETVARHMGIAPVGQIEPSRKILVISVITKSAAGAELACGREPG
jgi:hypothetical protein